MFAVLGLDDLSIRSEKATTKQEAKLILHIQRHTLHCVSS